MKAKLKIGIVAGSILGLAVVGAAVVKGRALSPEGARPAASEGARGSARGGRTASALACELTPGARMELSLRAETVYGVPRQEAGDAGDNGAPAKDTQLL